MNTSPFTVEEIDALQVVLNAAMTEAKEQGIEVPVSVMLARLFAAASTGERSPEKLKAAVLNRRGKCTAGREREVEMGRTVEPSSMLDSSSAMLGKQR